MQAQEALRESEERYRVLFDSAPMAVFACDQNGVIQTYNRRAVELWGREPVCGVERHCGSSKLFLPNGSLLPHAQSPMVEVLRTGIPATNVEVTIERPDGSRIPVVVNFAPLKGAHGEITGVITSFIDITERKQAEGALREAAERFRFMAESMPQKIFTAKPNGEVDYFNQQWTEFTGLSFEQIKDWGWTQFIHPDDVQENVRRWQHAIDTGEPFQLEHRFRRADGTYRWHLSRAHLMRDADGKAVMWIGSNTDIDDAQRALKEREDHVDELRRTVRFSEMFIGILGHDLRNPLSAISTAASLLSRRAGESERIAKPVSRILISADRMERMISQLLDFTRIRLGRGIPLEPARVDVAELTRLVSEEVELACGREIQLEIAGDTWGSFDRDRLSQLVSNLAANACQHGTAGTPVKVQVDGTAPEVVRLEVRNQGVIPHDLLPVVFEPLHDTGDGARKHAGASGLGLGLYITQQIAHAHGGTIRFESDETRGTRFIVALPRGG